MLIGVTTHDTACVTDTGTAAESVTLITKSYTPAPISIGRPARYVKPGASCPMVSPGPCSVTPGGSVPDSIDHVYGRVPPCANSACETLLPTVAYPKNVPFVMASGCGTLATTRSEKIFCAVPPAPCVCTVKDPLNVLNVVPEISPVDEFRLKPPGSEF